MRRGEYCPMFRHTPSCVVTTVCHFVWPLCVLSDNWLLIYYFSTPQHSVSKFWISFCPSQFSCHAVKILTNIFLILWMVGHKKRVWYLWLTVAYSGILFGGVQQINLRTEGRQNGDLGAVAP
jgi:hypothetical protein